MESYFAKVDCLFTDGWSAFRFAAVVVILSSIATLIHASVRKNGRSRLPPGPISLPIIGNLHLLGSLPHQSLFHLSRKHGPLMYFKLGAVPAVVASSPAFAKEFLRTHDQIFASRPQTAAVKILGNGSESIGFAPYGSFWRMMKKLCVTELFAPKRIEYFRNIREEETFSLVQSLSRNFESEKEVDVGEMFSSLSNNTIFRMALGKKYGDVGGEAFREASDFTKLMEEFFDLVGAFNAGDYIPLLKRFDLQGYERRMRNVTKTLEGIMDEIIKKRRQSQSRKTEEEEDLLDVMLFTMENNPEVSLATVKAVIQEILMAGTDTVAATSEWALSELLRHPASLQKVQDELDREVGRERMVQESDLDRLTYLQAVVKETFRLHPAAPLLAPHQSTQACKVAGYDIPADVRLMVNVWAIGRDPDAWSNAWEFWPERFIDQSTNFRGNDFELIPFGSGRRICPGLPLANIILHLALATVIQSFEWKVAGVGEVDMRETFGLVVRRAVPLRAVATPRLPLHLYSGNQMNK